MRFRILIKASAEKELDALPEAVHDRIAVKIEALADIPRPLGCVKLRGHDEEYRIRVGNYRVLYTIDTGAAAVTIVAVGHRREVYR